MLRAARARAPPPSAVAPPAAVPPPGAPPPAPAPAAADSTAHRHLGFFIRLDLGAGYLGSSASQGGLDSSISGFAVPFGVAVGGAVMENFILGGDVWAIAALSPSMNVNGITGTASDSSMGLSGLGLNLTCCFMPANVYVSFTPSMVMATLTVSRISADTQVGFGGKVGVGKEWWVGDHGGLGLAGQFFFGFSQDEGPNPPTWTTFGGTLAFSATCN
jgi:hypothetical protein